MIQSRVIENGYAPLSSKIYDIQQDYEDSERIVHSFCALITPASAMDPTSMAFKQVAILQSGKLAHFLEILKGSGTISASLIGRLTEIQGQSSQIFYGYHQFISYLTNKNFAQIPLCLETAQLLQKGLSLECQRYLSDHIQQALYGLDQDDLVRYALLAFQRILSVPHQGPQYRFDGHILNAFQRLQETFPSMARELSARLQEELHSDQGLKAELVCGQLAGSWHGHLLSLLPENHLSLLRASLLSRLHRLLDVPHGSNIEWMPYQKLITLLQTLPGESRTTFNHRLIRLGRKALSTFEANMDTLRSDVSFFLGDQQKPFKRAYLYRCASFLFFFGSVEKKERFDQLLEQAFMVVQQSLLGPESGQAQRLLDWISPLMILSLNETLQSHFQHLKKVLAQLPNLSEKQKMTQVIAPYALVAYFNHVNAKIEKELQRYAVTSSESLSIVREHLSKQLQYYQLPYPGDVLMGGLLVDKPSAFSWLRRSVCEKQEPYLLYGLLMMAKVLHLKTQWQERLKHPHTLPMVVPETISEELIHFSQTLKKALQLGQGQLSRSIEATLHPIEEYFNAITS